MSGGVGLLLRALTPEPGLLVASAEDLSEQTAALLEKVLTSTRDMRTKLQEWGKELPRMQANLRSHLDEQRKAGSEGERMVRPAQVLKQLSSLLSRIEALAQTEAVQQRQPNDGDLLMLEGIACRYLPEIVEALDDTFDFIMRFTGTALTDAVGNLVVVHDEFNVMSESVARLEQDVVRGVTHSLDVHAEFLRQRLNAQDTPSIIDI